MADRMTWGGLAAIVVFVPPLFVASIVLLGTMFENYAIDKIAGQ